MIYVLKYVKAFVTISQVWKPYIGTVDKSNLSWRREYVQNKFIVELSHINLIQSVVLLRKIGNGRQMLHLARGFLLFLPFVPLFLAWHPLIDSIFRRQWCPIRAWDYSEKLLSKLTKHSSSPSRYLSQSSQTQHVPHLTHHPYRQNEHRCSNDDSLRHICHGSLCVVLKSSSR